MSMTPTEAVRAKIKELHAKAEAIWHRTFNFPLISFELRGTRAGVYRHQGNRLEFNYQLLKENLDSFLETTVPHELAHLINAALHGGRVKSHGKEFFEVGRQLGYELTRTHSYDVTNSKHHVVQEFEYYCGCKTHKVKANRHNKIIAGRASYHCRKCGGELKRSNGTSVIGARSLGFSVV